MDCEKLVDGKQLILKKPIVIIYYLLKMVQKKGPKRSK